VAYRFGSMDFFKRWNLNRAARRYARVLPPWLARGYGASGTYTRGQIERSVDALRLNRRYIALVYALYLTEEDYKVALDTSVLRLEYVEARRLMHSFLPRSEKQFHAESHDHLGPPGSIGYLGGGGGGSAD
jgi:hypothetical protein